ncbi:MAG: NAD-dependent epimerase/dehydratase family protein [Candidatus Izemoplasmatales bacterium]|jgi:UDP-glucose 4-epimerase
MKIICTGSRGFVGVETCKLLEEKGHEIIHYDLMTGYDIMDFEQLLDMAIDADRILHLAAIARFEDCDRNPRLAYETNVLGTKNVAEVAKYYHIPVVYASTGSTYMPITQEPPITEDFQTRGNSVYGCSKAVAEKYIQECNPYIILRYSHLYGKEKRMHGLIGNFIGRINKGLQPELYGGRQSSDFLYIKDVAEANYLALTSPWDKWNQVYNIGSGEELTAEKAVEILKKVTGYDGYISEVKGRSVDPERFVYNTDKAETMLKFKAKYSFEKGLRDMNIEEELC